ncbi:CdaR family protein [Mahella australiensis]|uniref:YbbR family protein n=1 Tax=Mahella australiensis (strain DSM 15567 / CIP 107919 / 50-1 BON) TaxID=697281 RepID=F4A1A3_MAHA5|nr:CdaR family protein [Mahella australiensis]AEE97022.1 YbbR family protein [Mahella australiensis 50-1 BON]
MDKIWATMKSNLPQKIISIVFAIILWTYVASDQNPNIARTIRNIPVEIQNESVLKNKNLIRMNTDIQEVSVKIEGRRSDVAAFKPYDIRAVADIGSINSSGKQRIPVKVINVPSNINIIDISPPYIEVEVEDIVNNQLPVELKLEGQPAVNHRVLEAELVPDEIIVTGPRSLVSKVRSAVVRMDVTEAKYDITRSLPIILYDEREKQITDDLNLSADFVRVYQKIRAVKAVPVKVNTSGKLPDGLEIVSIAAQPSNVTVAGSDDDISKVTVIETEPIDLSKVQATSTVKAQLISLDGIEVIEGEPVMVDITVKEQDVQGKVAVTDLVIENLAEDLEVGDKPRSITLSVKGPYSLIKNLKPSDIKVVVNAKGMSRGRYDVTPTIVLPKGIELIKVEPQPVSVLLK